MKERIVALLLTLVLGIGMFTGCSKEQSEESKDIETGVETGQTQDGEKDGTEEVTLTFWMEMTTPELDEAYQEAVDGYMELHPNVKIEYLGIPGNAIDAKNKLEMAFSANAAPDVFHNFMPEFIARGNIISLTDYYENSSLKGNIAQASIDANITYDPNREDIYAIPSYMNMRNFWIRSDWYKEAGIDIPTTWDEFFDSINKVTDLDNNRYGTAIRGGAGGAQNLEYMMYSYSGITEAFDENGKSTINDPLHIEFAEKYLSLYNEYTAEDDLSKGWTELAAAFQSETAASIFHNLGSAKMIEDTFAGDYSKFEIFPMPVSVKGYNTHPVVDAQGYSISSSCENPDVAWDFITYMVSGEAAANYVEVRGGIPVETEAAKADWVTSKPYYVKAVEYMNDPELKLFEEPLYLTQYRNILANVAEPKMQEAMVGLCSVEEFLNEWADAMTEEKAAYDETYAQ